MYLNILMTLQGSLGFGDVSLKFLVFGGKSGYCQIFKQRTTGHSGIDVCSNTSIECGSPKNRC